MTAEERNKYIEFMYDYKNEYNCENCPENRGDFPHDKLPCGQQNCWVTCHCKGMQPGGGIRRRKKDDNDGKNRKRVQIGLKIHREKDYEQ